MQLKIIAFGIARDIVGQPTITFDLATGESVGDLKAALAKAYPKLDALASLAIAVNQEYAKNEICLSPEDEIVLIPPVSGG